MRDGRSARETARLFGVSVASVVKWSQRLRSSGSAASRPMGGHRKRVLIAEQAWMLERLAARPDLTVRGLAAELRERGIRVSHNTVWSLLRSAGFSFKKNAVRRRTREAADRQATGAVEEIPRPA
jgi:transposase